MELSSFRIAEDINRKKEALLEQRKRLEQGSWSLGVKIELKTGYSDMGRAYTVTAEFDGDMTVEICKSVKDILNRRIEALEKEFKEL